MKAMSPVSNILLSPTPGGNPVQILQLYEHVELFREGEPPSNSLFILGRAPLPLLDPANQAQDELLLVDPPTNLASRFRIEGNAAVVFTTEPQDVGLPQVQTIRYGVAHVRIGQHYLDIYAQRIGALIHLPTLGILCGGWFGSDMSLPQIAPGSDGEEELDTLRLLARLVKQHRFQLFIPRLGSLAKESFEVMRRLATDVAYLHNLRRVVPALVQRGDSLAALQQMADSLLPQERHSALNHDRNLSNLEMLYTFHRAEYPS
jgi:hypothetical protein